MTSSLLKSFSVFDKPCTKNMIIENQGFYPPVSYDQCIMYATECSQNCKQTSQAIKNALCGIAHMLKKMDYLSRGEFRQLNDFTLHKRSMTDYMEMVIELLIRISPCPYWQKDRKIIQGTANEYYSLASCY